VTTWHLQGNAELSTAKPLVIHGTTLTQLELSFTYVNGVEKGNIAVGAKGAEDELFLNVTFDTSTSTVISSVVFQLGIQHPRLKLAATMSIAPQDLTPAKLTACAAYESDKFALEGSYTFSDASSSLALSGSAALGCSASKPTYTITAQADASNLHVLGVTFTAPDELVVHVTKTAATPWSGFVKVQTAHFLVQERFGDDVTDPMILNYFSDELTVNTSVTAFACHGTHPVDASGHLKVAGDKIGLKDNGKSLMPHPPLHDGSLWCLC
jgi:hypothetical protein